MKYTHLIGVLDEYIIKCSDEFVNYSKTYRRREKIMKKRNVVVLLATVAALGMSACGAKELELTANQVEVELGSELDTAATSYVADADVAAEATVDFSAVDMTKTGTYSATVTYKDQTAGFDVIVTDTTAPIVDVQEQVVVAAGEPLYAKDVMTSVTELSGEVEVAFSEPETSADETVTVEGTEKAEDTEMAEPTEEVEGTEAEETATTETVVGTEAAEVEAPEAEFVLNDVICSNASVTYAETGEYDNTLTVTDASGNSTDVTVHIVVGDAPEIEGVEDMTVTVGTGADEIDFLDSVTAKDSSGNDITANIVCDSAAVNLETAGEYTITYTVTDENGFTATKTATVTVEEKSGKKSDSKKSDSGKVDSKTDSAKKNDTSSSNSSNNSNAASNGASGGNAASGGNSNQASGDSGNSGNNSNSGNSNQASGESGNSGNNNNGSNNQTSGGGSASGDSGNSGNSGNASTPSAPSTDNDGNTGEPSTPSVPSTDNGNASTGGGNNDYEMSVPDDAIEGDSGLLDNTGTGGTDGGGVTGGGSF